jgi:hypothetical protein
MLNRVLSECISITVVMLLFATVACGQREQVRGVKVEPKQFPDLKESTDSFAPIPFDIEAVQEHDSVAGVCEGPDGSVVAAVDVKLFRYTYAVAKHERLEELIGSAKSDGEGKFSFAGLQERFPTDRTKSCYLLVFQKEGFATQFVSSVSWKGPEQRISLAKRAMVRGVIKNDLGEPVVGAKVSFHHSLKKSLPDVFGAVTDEKGGFQIDDYRVLNSRGYKTNEGEVRGSIAVSMIVEHPDHGRVVLMVERTPNLFLVTINRGAMFTGRVVDEEGVPVAGCRLRIQSHSSENSHIGQQFQADEKGEFRLTKLPDIPVNLSFSHPDLAGEAKVLVGELGSENEIGDVTLVKPVLVQGVLMDEATDRPAAMESGETCRVSWNGPDRPRTSAGVSSAIVSEDGTFEIGFLPGMNFPYLNSTDWELVEHPYPDGLEVSRGEPLELKFLVRRKSDR